MEQPFSDAVLHRLSLIKSSQKTFEGLRKVLHEKAKDVVDFDKIIILPGATEENIKCAEYYSRSLNRAILQMRADRMQAAATALEQVSNDDKLYYSFANEERGVRIVVQRIIDSYTEWDENLYSKYEQIEMMLIKRRYNYGN